MYRIVYWPNIEIAIVSDGDTVVLLDSTNTQIKVRLDGIDCTESGQDYGNKATEFVRELTRGRKIKVEVKGTDIYKRTLEILFTDNINVNVELLKNGLAWRYKYNKSDHYLRLENEARSKKLNIWSMKNPVAPWDFRKTPNQNSTNKTNNSVSKIAPIPSGTYGALTKKGTPCKRKVEDGGFCWPQK